MGEPVQQGRSHLGVAEHLGPFAEARVSSDNDAGALVEFVQQVEQRCPANRTERYVVQLVKDNEVEAQPTLGELICLVCGLLLLQRVNQFDGRE